MVEKTSPGTQQDLPDAEQSSQKAVLPGPAGGEQSRSEDASGHEINSHLVKPRTDDVAAVEYVVWPKDGANKDAVAKTEDFLKQLTQQSTIFSYTEYSGDLILWAVNITNSQVNTIKQNEGVASVEQNVIVAEGQAAVPVPTEPAKLSEANKAKRDIQYNTQLNAKYELRMISQPNTVKKIDDLENYVYKAKGSKEIYIYHVEEGINTQMTSEFPFSRLDSFLQTRRSIALRQSPYTDGSNGHSTETASKAVGEKYGSAKQSKLVVVKMAALDTLELGAVFDRDIETKGRIGKAVVTVSWSSISPQDPKNLGFAWKNAQKHIKTLLDKGIPVFVPAGNYAKKKYNGEFRINADTAPAIFEGDDYPIIVAGNVDSKGLPFRDSQRGPHVKVWAPGTRVTAQNAFVNAPKVVTGTSYSAPLLPMYLGRREVVRRVKLRLAE